MSGPMQIWDQASPSAMVTVGGRVAVSEVPQDSLEDLLLLMTRWGNPRLSKQIGGWYCAVDVKVNAAGVDFKVQSDFDRDTPHAAALQCKDRMVEALKGLGVNA